MLQITVQYVKTALFPIIVHFSYFKFPHYTNNIVIIILALKTMSTFLINN